MNISLLTIVYEKDYKLLSLQFKSIDKYAKDIIFNEHVVIFNCKEDISKEINEIANNSNYSVPLKIISGFSLLKSENIHHRGWYTQQILKLKAYEFISNDHYLVLDSKNHLVNDFSFDDLFIDSKPIIYFERSKRVWGNILIECCKEFDINPDEIELFFSPSTPFLFIKKHIKGLIEFFNQQEKDLEDEICAKRGITEFIIYYCYLSKNSLIKEYHLIHKDKSHNFTIFKSAQVDSEYLNDLELKLSEIKWFGVHSSHLQVYNKNLQCFLIKLWGDKEYNYIVNFKTDMNFDLCVLAYADINYYIFVIPYIYFCLKYNKNTIVEILLDDKNLFEKENENAIKYMDEIFPNRFILSQSKKFRDVLPNSVRFLEQPTNKTKYVYIGDIDLLIFESILDVHLDLIRDNSLDFSNVIRKNSKRLTGLHFIEYDKMYPLPYLEDIDLSHTNDEELLYIIMERKGRTLPVGFKKRPLLGVHFSLNRTITGDVSNSRISSFSRDLRLHWNIFEYSNILLESFADPKYLLLHPYLYVEFKAMMLGVESHLKKRDYHLHRFSLDFLVDRRFLSHRIFTDKADMKNDRSNILKSGGNPSEITTEMNLIWPNDKHILIYKAVSAFDDNDYDVGVSCLIHLLHLGNRDNLIGFLKNRLNKIKLSKHFERLVFEIENSNIKNKDEFLKYFD